MPKFFTYQRPQGPKGKGPPGNRFGAPIPGRKEPKVPKGATAKPPVGPKKD